MNERLINLFDKYKFPAALSFLGLVLIIGGVIASGLTRSKAKEYPKESMTQAQKLLSVDVSGAVKNAGVYHLIDGSRIEDAIKAAGGFAENANQEYISKYLNMAQKLSDGGKIYVPAEGETVSGGGGGAVAGVNTSKQINVNTATQAELEALPGVGPVTASRIISDRPYQNIEELTSKKVVSKSVFEKIKDQVVTY